MEKWFRKSYIVYTIHAYGTPIWRQIYLMPLIGVGWIGSIRR